MYDCISAISTPHGRGGVAIIRLSGEGATDIAKKMFEPQKKTGEFKPRYMYFGKISGDGFFDSGFMVFFKAPHSFTGEDIVEFHCHGGVQIAEGILKKTFLLGARGAEKGEFTRRAFLNGKLSLSSAEGMIDMINAESLALLRAGSMLYNEELAQKVRLLQDKLKDILAAIAAEVDYPEEDLDGLDLEKIKSDVVELHGEISKLAASYSIGKKIKNGVSVAICGKPNAGKSSLLNRLLGYNKAIVSPAAGTTRDIVEGSIEIDGVQFDLYDTAGLREDAGEIEKLGVELAKSKALSADIVLLLTDGSCETPKIRGKLIRAFSKSDILTPAGEYDIAISSKTGEGIEELKELLYKSSIGESANRGFRIVEERHYNALCRAERALKEGAENVGELTPDLIAIDLKEGWDALGEITGETANEEIINAVFSKFCVGK